MATPINFPATAQEAWREFQKIALSAQETPDLLDNPDYRESFKIAHARFWRRFMEGNV